MDRVDIVIQADVALASRDRRKEKGCGNPGNRLKAELPRRPYLLDELFWSSRRL